MSPEMNGSTDLYLMTLARQMRSDDVVHVGASQVDVWQAAEVARRLWAPGLRVVAAGTYILGTGSSTALLRSRTYARDLIAARQATFTQSRVFDDLRRTRVVFAGGLQVDQRGNANLIGFMNGERYVRGPGSAGLPTLTSHAERFFIAMPCHGKRALVGKVDGISVLGDPVAREAMGLPAHSLQQVITPLASFRPGPEGLELISTSPGVTLADVQAATGFEVRTHADCCERLALTADEHGALTQVRAATTLTSRRLA